MNRRPIVIESLLSFVKVKAISGIRCQGKVVNNKLGRK